jgi:hypothetical protein
MHTPRMNYRQSISLNEAVMEAMTGRMSDSKIKADLEKMSDKELKDTTKLLKAMKDNQEMISKAAFDTAEEMGLMEMEEESGAMGGRGGAAPPAGGAARGGFGGFGGPGKPTGTRPGKGPNISKKGGGKKKRPFKLPKLPDLPEILPFDVDPNFLDKLFKKVTKGLSDLTGVEENDTVNKFLKNAIYTAIPELGMIDRVLKYADRVDKDRDEDGEGGNQPG